MALKCWNCGANITPDQITCDYCDSTLVEKENTKLVKPSTKNEVNKELSTSIDKTSFKYRDQGKIAILLIVTCGLYYFVLLRDWLIVIKQNKQHGGTSSINPTLAVFLTILTCTGASIYFNYKVARDAASISRKSGGNSSSIRKGLTPPPDSLPDIIFWGGLGFFIISIFSGGFLAIIDVIFAIWSTIALQKSVEYMAGVGSDD